MSYTTAKTNFEATIKSMHAELQRYANSDKANQRTVDIKTDIINKLVDYYNASEALISNYDDLNFNAEFGMLRLRFDTQKLVTFVERLGYNPNLIFNYTEEQLQYSTYGKIKVLGVRKIGGFDVPILDIIDIKTGLSLVDIEHNITMADTKKELQLL